MTAQDLLREAAQRAEKASNVKQAIRTAWSGLHASGDPETMMEAFRAWAESEGITSTVSSIQSNLSPVVRRRSKSPADVAASLRKAADR